MLQDEVIDLSTADAMQQDEVIQAPEKATV
jgi:hypothetical protein